MVLGWNTFSHFFHALPHFSFLNANNLTSIGRGFPQLYLRFDFYVICFAFLSTLDILLSMWVFHLLAVLQIGLSNRIGFLSEVGNAGVPAMNSYGLIAFVVWGLWTGRGHLRDVWQKAIGRAQAVDDSGEFLSYRFSVIALAASLLFIFFTLLRMQMGPVVALAFMGFTFVLYLSMAKIVSLSGLVSVRGPNPAGEARTLVGTWNMSDTSIASLSQMSALYGNAKGFVMPGTVNAARAGEYAAPQRRRLGAAVIAAGVLGVVAFLVTSLVLGYYGPGAESFGSYDYNRGNRFAYDSVVTGIKGRTEAVRNVWELVMGLIGAAVTLLLLVLNQRMPGWPLHRSDSSSPTSTLHGRLSSLSSSRGSSNSSCSASAASRRITVARSSSSECCWGIRLVWPFPLYWMSPFSSGRGTRCTHHPSEKAAARGFWRRL